MVLSRANTRQAWVGASPQSPCQGEEHGFGLVDRWHVVRQTVTATRVLSSLVQVNVAPGRGPPTLVACSRAAPKVAPGAANYTSDQRNAHEPADCKALYPVRLPATITPDGQHYRRSRPALNRATATAWSTMGSG